MRDSKNDVAWRTLFEKHRIAETVAWARSFVISARMINRFREARLMTKFDHKANLPAPFVEHGLSILPVTRGNYVIAPIETFHQFEDEHVPVPIEVIPSPAHLQTINHTHIPSESLAIHCAFATGMLGRFTSDPALMPTVSGRMSSSTFRFTIDRTDATPQTLQVENTQLEIDGGYEGSDSFCLIEAKNVIASDFLIRQLYYPYRLWSQRLTKPVRPIFLTTSNGIFHFREYTFTDPTHYNSLHLIRQKRYVIGDYAINRDTIRHLLTQTRTHPEPNIPFPQADSFERVINLCELLYQSSELGGDDITQNYDFEGRQTHYYVDAGRYLGLIDKERRDGNMTYFLTERGEKLFDMPIVERQIAFIRAILAHEPFNRALKLYLDGDARPTPTQIVHIMRGCHLQYADTTAHRRAHTLLSWLDWILQLA